MIKHNNVTENVSSRRDFLKLLGIGSIVSVAPTMVNAATSVPHIVIVGGGFSGATCAKYLKKWGGSSIEVTIIEKNSQYVSPILSNLVLNGAKTTTDLTFDYNNLHTKYQINFVHNSVESIDKTNKTVILDNNTILNYDKLVLAAGIDFIVPNTYDFTKVPHAWIAGKQTDILKSQIETIQDGDTFVMSIPQSPYRCPPGPYERACVIADYLKNTKGFKNSKVVVLDANSDIIVEKDTFGAKFLEYGVDYQTNCQIVQVDDTTNTVTYLKDTVQKSIAAEVLNIIPNQKAAKLVFDAGLVSGNWAPVNLLSYESSISSDVYVIGDSHLSIQPKAGHIGNSEAKVCADAILRQLNNVALYASPKTNSACYSPVSATEASWLSAVYSFENGEMVLANFDSGAPTTKNYRDMFNWSGNLFSDTFS